MIARTPGLDGRKKNKVIDSSVQSVKLDLTIWVP